MAAKQLEMRSWRCPVCGLIAEQPPIVLSMRHPCARRGRRLTFMVPVDQLAAERAS